MPHRLCLENFGPVHALPILHYKMEFAHLVREAVARLNPDCICIELPPTLKDQFLRGVARLPELSVLSYETLPAGRSGAGRDVYLIIEPADPLVEASRLARKESRRATCSSVGRAGPTNAARLSIVLATAFAAVSSDGERASDGVSAAWAERNGVLAMAAAIASA